MSAEAEPKAEAASQAAELHQSFRAASDKLRARADLTAKALGGIGTALLTAVGLAKVGDVSPLPDTNSGWAAAIALVLSFGLMAFVIAFFTHRLWRLNEPVVFASEVSEMQDLRDDDERKEVKRIYKQHADLNYAPSLAVCEARAHRLQRIAERCPDAEATRLRADADVIATEVMAQEARAALVVIRRRAANTINDGRAKSFYALFVAAAVVFAVSADRLDSERSGETAVAKQCAEAQAAGATTLPNICDDYLASKKAEEAPTPEGVADQAATALATGVTP